MTQGLEAITTATVALALDAASLRQQAIAANVANVNTVGYIPQRVDFEAQLDDARRALQERGTVDPFALSGVRLQLTPMLDAAGQPEKVQLDVEMANMAQNAVQYQALAKGIARHLAILYTAASDGKK